MLEMSSYFKYFENSALLVLSPACTLDFVLPDPLLRRGRSQRDWDLVMGGSSGGGSRTTTQSTEPWEGQQPFLKQGFAAAQKEFNSGRPEFFPDSTVVPYSGETEAGLNLQTNQALDPNSTINLANQEVGNTLQGENLSPDSQLYNSLLNGITRSVRPNVDSAFASAGRFGSPLHAEATARGVTQGFMPFLENERGRQFAATERAGQTSQFVPAQLRDVGGQREALSRDMLQEDIDRFNFDQSKEAAKVQQYLGNITGNYGRTTTATQPNHRNPLMSGLGTGLMGASLGRDLFGNPNGGGMFSSKG
jgi:hypothetical protein